MKFSSIQYIRGIAALLVVLYHESVYLERIAGQPQLHAFWGERLGLYGVLAFFVLSGFLMAEIAPKYRPASFLLHRVCRIYPAYWLSVALAVLLFRWLQLALADGAYVPDIEHMLFSSGSLRDLLRLTLAPITFNDYPLGVEWTLLYETTFYVVIFAVSLAGAIRYLPAVVLVWLAAIAWSVWRQPQSQPGFTMPSIATLPWFAINAAFIFGVLGSWLQARIPPWIAIAAGAALLASLEFVSTRWNMLQVCAASAALVIGLICLERRGSLWRSAALRRLGDWSYAMYLLHVPVIIATLKVLSRFSSSAWLLLAVTTAVVLGVAAAVGELDLFAYYRLKAAVDGAPRATRRVAAGVFLALFFGAAWVGLRSS